MKQDDQVVVVFLGDATTEEGVTAESLNFAALKKLPVIFFCENNFYSVQSPLAARQPPRDIRAWAATHGMPADSVDGVNVLAVHEAVRAAVERARTGGGPTFIELALYRFRAHGGAGDDSRAGYRAEAERVAWEAVDPLHLFGELPDALGSARCRRHPDHGNRHCRRNRRRVRPGARKSEPDGRRSIQACVRGLSRTRPRAARGSGAPPASGAGAGEESPRA